MPRLTQVSVVANPALLKLKNFGITVMPTTEITAKEKLQTVKKEQTSFYDEEKPLMVIDYNTHTDEIPMEFADFPAELRLLSVVTSGFISIWYVHLRSARVCCGQINNLRDVLIRFLLKKEVSLEPKAENVDEKL